MQYVMFTCILFIFIIYVDTSNFTFQVPKWVIYIPNSMWYTYELCHAKRALIVSCVFLIIKIIIFLIFECTLY